MLSPYVASQCQGQDQKAQTPDWLLARLHDEFHFDFDPCPNSWTPHCGWSGLDIPWGRCTYVNPPYDACAEWLSKAVHELHTRGVTSVFLIPTRPWTNYWKEHVWPHASEVRILDSTVAFKGYTTKLPTSLCLVIFYAPDAPLRMLDRPSRTTRLFHVPEAQTIQTLLDRIVYPAGYLPSHVHLLMGSLGVLGELVAQYHRDRTAQPLVLIFAARLEAAPFHQHIFPACDDLYFTHPVLKADDTKQRLYSGSVVAIFDTDLTRRAALANHSEYALLTSPYDATPPPDTRA